MIYITNDHLNNFILGAKNYITEQQGSNVIVGVSRGGLVPAVYLSHETGIPMIPVDFSAETGRGTSKHTNVIPPLSDYDNVYIVDDIADTGHTVKGLAKWYSQLNKNVHILVMVHKQHSVVTPEYALIHTDSAEWIVFPWEKKDGKEESEENKKAEVRAQ